MGGLSVQLQPHKEEADVGVSGQLKFLPSIAFIQSPAAIHGNCVVDAVMNDEALFCVMDW